MTNSEFQKRVYSAFLLLKINNEYKFINKLKKGGLIKNSKETINVKDNNIGKFSSPINATKWKYAKGGVIQKMQEAGVALPPELAGMNYANAKRYWEALGDLDPRLKAGILGNIYIESKMYPNAKNARYRGLTLLDTQRLKPNIPARYYWVAQHYGTGGDNEIRYVLDYVNGKLTGDSSFGYGSKKYIAGHNGNYTVNDSTNLFRKYYEGTGHNSEGRRLAARAIYKLFNVEPTPEPLLTVQPLSEISSSIKIPIVELPDVLAMPKLILPIRVHP